MVNKLYNISEPDGKLFPIELKEQPFNVKRIFYVTNVPKGEERGQHAHYQTQQQLICIQGNIDVKLHDGKELKTYNIKDGESIFIDKMIYDSQVFNTGKDILLVLCSTNYDKGDYIEDFDEFIELAK